MNQIPSPPAPAPATPPAPKNNPRRPFLIYQGYKNNVIISESDINHHDVILGRGARINKQCGNVQFRNLVQMDVVKYYEAKRGDKPIITRRIVQYVHNQGGRFLQVLPNHYKKDDMSHIRNCNSRIHNCSYLEIDDKAAMAKTSQTFRDVIAQTLKSDPTALNPHLRESVSLCHPNSFMNIVIHGNNQSNDDYVTKDHPKDADKEGEGHSEEIPVLLLNHSESKRKVSAEVVLFEEQENEHDPHSDGPSTITNVNGAENDMILPSAAASDCLYNVFSDHDISHGFLTSTETEIEKQTILWSSNSSTSPPSKVPEDSSLDVISI